MLRFLAISLLLLASASLAGVRPAWVETAASAGEHATIKKIVAGAAQDLVVVEQGLEAGLRRGIVADVTRGEIRKGRVLIAEASTVSAVALIIELAPGQTLMGGDRVTRALVRL